MSAAATDPRRGGGRRTVAVGIPRAAHRPLAARAVLAAATAMLVLLPADPAGAHVTVQGESATAGGYTVLTFRAPTESADASTTSLTIQLPQDTPFTSVRTKPVPGWTAELVETDLPEPVEVTSGATLERAVTEIRWTTDGDGLGPGEFGEFEVSLGPLPEPGTVHFPVVQGYSDGTTVDWVQQVDGDAEAQYPAPSLEVIEEGAAVDAHGAAEGGAVDATGTHDPAAESEPVGSTGSGGAPALLLSALAVAVSVAAAVLAGVALRRRR